MTFLYKSGTFTSITGTGSQSITGVGFQPKAVIIFGAATFEDAYSANALYTIGLTDGTSSFCTSAGCLNNTSGQTDRRNVSGVFPYLTNGSVGVAVQSTITSLDSDGFTLNFSTNTSARDYHFIAIAGTDVTNTKAGTFTSAGATGNKAVTGIGFKPDFIILTTATSGVSTAAAGAIFGVGFAASPTSRAAFSVSSNTAATRRTWRYQRTNKCAVEAQFSTTVFAEADLVSFDSDGFTLNYSTDAGASVYGYLAIKGGQYSVGSFNANTTTGNQSVTGLPFAPVGLMLASVDAVSATTVNTNNSLSGGMADNFGGTTTQQSFGANDKDNAASLSSRYDSKTHCFEAVSTTSTAAQTRQMEATVNSWDSAGFTLNWGLNTGTLGAIEIIYVAFGTPLTRVTSVPTLKYALKKRVTDVNTIKYALKARVADVNTVKYALKRRIPTIRTVKYAVKARIATLRILKYKLTARLLIAKTLKYALRRRIPVVRTVKYKLTARLLNVRIVKYALKKRIPSQRTTIYALKKRIPSQRTLAYALKRRIPTIRTTKYALKLKVVTARTFKYKLTARLPIVKTLKYSLRKKVTTNRTIKYGLKARIVAVRTLKYALKHRIPTQRTTKYALRLKVVTVRTVKYKLTARLASQRILVYALKKRIPSITRSLKYSLKARIAVPKTIKYKLTARLLTVRIVKYGLKHRVTTVRTIKYALQVVGLTRIGSVGTIKYGLKLRVPKQSTLKYKLLLQIKTTRTVNYAVKLRVATLRTIKYMITADVSCVNLVKASSQYIDCTNDTRLKQGETAGSEVTWSYWFRATALPASNAVIFIPGARSTIHYINSSTGHLTINTYYHDATNVQYSSPNVCDSKWHNVVHTHSNVSNNTYVYLDGTQVYTNAKTDYLASSGILKCFFGGENNGANAVINSYNGQLDDLRVYNTQLTSAEASTIAGGGSVTRGIIARFKLDENTGTTTTDSIAGIVATLKNGATWYTTVLPFMLAELVRIATIRIIKYAVRARLQTQNTIKYRLLKRVPTLWTLKYALRKRVPTIRTVKYALRLKVVTSRTIKYGLRARLKSIKTIVYQLQTTIALTRVTSVRVIKYRLTARLRLANTLKYGLKLRVVKPQTLKYSLRKSVQSFRTVKYSLRSRLASARILRYSLRSRLKSSKSLKYSLLKRIAFPSSNVLKYSLNVRVVTSRILKYKLTARLRSSIELVYRLGLSFFQRIQSRITLIYELYPTYWLMPRFDRVLENFIRNNYSNDVNVINPPNSQISWGKVWDAMGTNTRTVLKCVQMPTKLTQLDPPQQVRLESTPVMIKITHRDQENSRAPLLQNMENYLIAMIWNNVTSDQIKATGVNHMLPASYNYIDVDKGIFELDIIVNMYFFRKIPAV